MGKFARKVFSATLKPRKSFTHFAFVALLVFFLEFLIGFEFIQFYLEVIPHEFV